ncbi:hypothetical protein BS78_05G200500 [Paspalum vaginatum]|nr:hypothetical protein BS78_05G200500 [Paspalum vaginatum]KAJ1276252.1 hypothetical protein BS78_05G200500 [Paspalum vaginatum]
MSFMKARQAVQTCVLSKRWRHLWCSAPCLDVDADEFLSEKTAAALAYDDNSSSSSVSITDYYSDDDDDNIAGSGNGIACNDHDSSESDEDTSSSSSDDTSSSGSEEDGTSSSSSDSDHQEDVYGSDSDHQDDDVNYVYTSSSESDDDGYSSDSDHDSIDGKEWVDFEDFANSLMLRCNMALLESFRLHTGSAPAFGDRRRQAGGWLRRAMRFSGSWHLKRLHLSNVDLDRRFAEHVGSACRSQQDLELDNCTCRIRSFTSGSLKNLVLRKCRWQELSEITCPTLEILVIEGGSNSYDCPVVISTPDVTYLRLAVHAPYFYSGISIGGEMPSLVKASIHLRCHRTSVFKSRFRGFQLNLLRSVSNATSLELSGVGIMAVSKEPTFHEFRNLRNLLLGNCDLSDRRTLQFFLHSSPNLEKLTLQHCKFSNDSEENKGTAKLNKSSSPEFHGLDFHRDNLKLEVIYKEEDACQLVEPLLHFIATNLSKNIKCFKVNQCNS